MRPYDYIIGDCIGMESCFDRSEDFDDLVVNRPPAMSPRRSRRRLKAEESREFPPPIPLLMQTENHSPHMPWVLRRHYSGDGRLVMWEERVKRHEYFRAERSNGRLMLHLVMPLADIDDSDQDGEDLREEEKGVVSVVEEAAAVMIENGKGSPGKCSNYDSGCFVRVPVPAISTVLS